MVVRNVIGVISILALAGCATTHGRSSAAQLEMKVSQLERQLEYKDDEIRSLKYEIADLSKKQVMASRVSSESDGEVSKKDVLGYKETGTVRMPVSTQDVQTALQKAGFYDGPIDGKIGNQTKLAIAAFQKQHNLTADGIIGVRTWAALEKYLE